MSTREAKTVAPKSAVPNDPPPPPPPPPPSESGDFNPLSESVNEKSYAGGGGAGPMPAGYRDIPEPTFTGPTGENGSDIPTKQTTKAEQKAQEEKPKPTANPDMQNLSDKEQHDGAAAMTDVILAAWGQAYKAGNNLFKISEKTINKLQSRGEIDMRVEVPYKMGVAPLTKVFQDYNNDAAEVLVLEKEFVEEVHPLITKELAKSGHGMSDKQQLIFLIGMKVASDAAKAVQFMGMKKEYLKFAREAMGVGSVVASATPVVVMTASPTVAPASAPDDHVAGEEQYQAPTTLQDQVTNHFIPNGVNNSLNIGNRGKLKNLNRVSRETAPPRKRPPVKKSPKEHIAAAKGAGAYDPPPDGKPKKKGRPPGAKNKK